jgi:ParB family chromosome partitioning protein
LRALLGGQPAAPAPAAGPPAAASLTAPSADAVRSVALAKIVTSPLQPRKDFPPEALAELADSIRAQGILNPLVVRAASPSRGALRRRQSAATSPGFRGFHPARRG